MTGAPKLSPYIVALSFQPAPLSLSTIFAASPSDATALATFNLMRANPEVGELAGIVVVEVSVEWLRSALRVAEGGPPEGAQVLSLVPQSPPAPGPTDQAVVRPDIDLYAAVGQQQDPPMPPGAA